jgi:hypothetical protein
MPATMPARKANAIMMGDMKLQCQLVPGNERLEAPGNCSPAPEKQLNFFAAEYHLRVGN